MNEFSIDELMSSARLQAGLDNFGPDDFMEGFRILVHGLNTETVITPNHTNDVRLYLLRLLINRLRFAKDLSDHPDILEERLGSPVIITSPPRTGSTKLQRILAATGDFQTVPLWKGHMFARIHGAPDGGVAERIAITQQYETWMYETSPNILTSHAEFTHEAAEDNVLCEFSFRHTHIFGLFDSPSYCQWIMQADLQPMYDYFHQQLQYLQWQFNPASSKPWVLKTPCHFGNEAYLCRTFENPVFLVTHRDPVKWMPSVTPTNAAYRKLYCDRDSTASFSADGTTYFARSVEDHIRWRINHPQFPVLDIPFRDVNQDGPNAVGRIYDFLGMAYSPAARQNVTAWEQDNARHKFGAHEYSAQSMGTDDNRLRKTFAAYLDRFAEFI
jgi:Sulfotransferase family